MSDAHARALYAAEQDLAAAKKAETLAFEATRYGHSEDRARHAAALEAYRKAEAHRDHLKQQAHLAPKEEVRNA